MGRAGPFVGANGRSQHAFALGQRIIESDTQIVEIDRVGFAGENHAPFDAALRDHQPFFCQRVDDFREIRGRNVRCQGNISHENRAVSSVGEVAECDDGVADRLTQHGWLPRVWCPTIVRVWRCVALLVASAAATNDETRCRENNFNTGNSVAAIVFHRLPFSPRHSVAFSGRAQGRKSTAEQHGAGAAFFAERIASMIDHPPRNATQLRALLDDARLGLKKSLGQNFMVDRNLRDAIVRDAGVTEADVVLEVGVGLGILTEGLLQTGGRVIGVELDERMVGLVSQLLSPYLSPPHAATETEPEPAPTDEPEPARHAEAEPALTLITGSVVDGKQLAHPVTAALQRARQTATARVLLVSNLPYHLAATVLIAALEWRSETDKHGIDGFSVLVQLEVAERLIATPSTELYGGLSILAQAHADLRITRRLPGNVFFPRPKIDSGFVVGVVREPAAEAPMGMSAAEYTHFKSVVHAAFQYRRKRLAKSLALGLALDPAIPKAAMDALGLADDTRGEQLDVKQFVALTRAIRNASPAPSE